MLMLPFRHWRVQSVKIAAQDASGIMASSMTLTTDDLTPLEDTVRCCCAMQRAFTARYQINRDDSLTAIALRTQESLPSYPSIKNGSVLNMHGQRPVQKAAPPPAPKVKLTANSVVTMGKMFDRGEIPGSHLSDLQEADMIRNRCS